MKKIIGLIFVLMMSIGVFPVFAQTGTRVVENHGNFSWQPPLNWTVTEFPGLKYRVAFGPIEGGLNVNINVVDETYHGTLRSYVDQSIALLSTLFQGFRLLYREEFRTNSGIVGEKVTIINYKQGFFLRQILYFLPGRNNTIFVITCTVPDSVASRFISIFDESIKTFEFIR